MNDCYCSPHRLSSPAKTICLVGLLILSLMTLPGCSGGAGDRLPLSGEVSFQGDPLDHGSIEFSSQETQRMAGGQIVDGKYSIEASQGLEPGTYVVRIYSSAEEGPSEGPPGPENINQLAKERIPKEYNTDSTKKIELSKDGEKEFNFDIP